MKGGRGRKGGVGCGRDGVERKREGWEGELTPS